MEDTGSRPRTIYGGTKWTEIPRNMKSPGKRTPRETKDIYNQHLSSSANSVAGCQATVKQELVSSVMKGIVKDEVKTQDFPSCKTVGHNEKGHIYL